MKFRLVRKDRLRELRIREYGYFDLLFLKSVDPARRNTCFDLMDKCRSQIRQDLFALVANDFKSNGFFVEFGATDGLHLNNTFLLESEFGWSGILAEPALGWHEKLKANRSSVVDTRCVWKVSAETLQFTEAPRGENSALSPLVSRSRQIRGEQYGVETVSLNDLLQQHGAPEVIDYLSVDTEGSEFDILSATDFDRWTFRAITVEFNGADKRRLIFDLLTAKGYARVFEDVSRFDDWYVRPDLLPDLGQRLVHP